MKHFATILILALPLAAQNPLNPANWFKPDAPKEDAGKLSALEFEKLLRIAAQAQLVQFEAQQKMAPLAAEQRAVIEAACTRAGIPKDRIATECIVDMQAGTVTQKKPEPPKDGN